MKQLLLAGLLALGTAAAVRACPEAETAYYGDETVISYDTETGVPTPLSTFDATDSITADATTPDTTTFDEIAFYETPTAGLDTAAMTGDGTAMRIVGRISGDTNRLTDRNLHVRTNGFGWTINAPRSVLSVDTNGAKLSVHDLHEGDWVVAEGTKIGSSRIKALAIRKLGDDTAGYQQSAFFMPNLGSGYALSIVGGPDFRTLAQESILGVHSQVAGSRQEIQDLPQDDPEDLPDD